MVELIQKNFTDTGRPDIWLRQRNLNVHNRNKMIKRSLIDQNLQKWHSNLQVSSKGINYQLYKDNIQLEQYFTLLQPTHHLPLVKFRTENHNFPVEVLAGRASHYQNDKVYAEKLYITFHRK